MDQKTILITGCSSGIGYHTAHFLKERGYRVFATARKMKDVTRLNEEGFEAFYLDLCDTASIQKALEEILKYTDGKLDALFNNGAYGQPGALEDLSTEDLKAQFETNVFGWHELTRRVIPIMRAQGHGRIIQNSSVLGIISLRFRGAYNASKYAIEGLSDTLRLELSGSNVFVSLIEPGPITSHFRANAYTHFKRAIHPETSVFQAEYLKATARFEGESGNDPFELPSQAVAKKVLAILEAKRPKAHYYVTVPTYLFGTLKRLLPTTWLDRILLKVT